MKTFRKEHEIVPGSVWRPCDGGAYRVRVQSVSNGEVFYVDAHNPGVVWDKDVFSFQVRYEPEVE